MYEAFDVRRAGQVVSQPTMVFPRCVLVLPPRAMHALRASSRRSALLCLVSALVVMTRRRCRVFGTGPDDGQGGGFLISSRTPSVNLLLYCIPVTTCSNVGL